MATAKQLCETQALMYSRSGGWWGQFVENVRLRLYMNLDPGLSVPAANRAWPHHIAGRITEHSHGRN